MSKERQKLVAQLDNIVSFIVRKRDKRCVLCGSDYNTAPSHFIKRGRKFARWNLDLVHLMCNECHTAWEENKSDKYAEFMVYKYDANFVLTSHKESRYPHKYTIEDLKAIKIEMELQMEHDYE
jgi:hypothetical protein